MSLTIDFVAAPAILSGLDEWFNQQFYVLQLSTGEYARRYGQLGDGLACFNDVMYADRMAVLEFDPEAVPELIRFDRAHDIALENMLKAMYLLEVHPIKGLKDSFTFVVVQTHYVG